jgi:hypothetical protein
MPDLIFISWYRFALPCYTQEIPCTEISSKLKAATRTHC